jgi:hypothetical protein
MKVTHFAAIAVLLAFTSASAPAFDMAEEIQAENAIRNAKRVTGRIAQIDEVPSVGVVDLTFANTSFKSNRASQMDASDFRIVASDNAGGVNRMRRALMANRATRAALDDHGIDVGDVVGVSITGRGSLRLYLLR